MIIDYDGVIIHVNRGMIEAALRLGNRRSASMNHAETKNSINMGFDTPLDRHFAGALGEIAWGRFTGFEVDKRTIGRGDGGTDFSGGIDIKTRVSWNRYRPNLLIPVKQWIREDRPKPNKYVLCWISKEEFEAGAIRTVRIVGWITAIDFDNKKVFRPKGNPFFVDTYEVTHTALNRDFSFVIFGGQ